MPLALDEVLRDHWPDFARRYETRLAPAIGARADSGDDALGISFRDERDGVINEALDGMDFVE